MTKPAIEKASISRKRATVYHVWLLMILDDQDIIIRYLVNLSIVHKLTAWKALLSLILLRLRVTYINDVTIFKMISIVNGHGLPVVFGRCSQYVSTPVVMQQVAAQQKKVGDFTALFAVGGPLVLSFKVKCSESS